MSHWVRHGLGIGIIVGGCYAASHFRVDAPSGSVSNGKQNAPAKRLPSTGITLQLAPGPAVQQPPRDPAPRTETDVVTRSTLAGRQPPPNLATNYQALQQDVLVPSGNPRVTAVPSEAAESRTHQISDGDSLEALAQRYLHDADRWQELLDANADVLTSRELLPVNAVIKIPRTETEPDRASRDAPGEAEGEELVPVRNR